MMILHMFLTICKSRILGIFIRHREILIVITILAGLYLLTTATTLIGFADSDELLAAGYSKGTPHPPGYPLYTVFLHLFMNIPFVNPIEAGHFLSGILQITTLIFVYKINLKLLEDISAHHQKRIAALSCALIGTSHMFWLTANYAEVFPLHNLITSILMLGLVNISQARNTVSPRDILGTVCAFGIGLAHHQLIVLWIPMILYVFYQARTKIIGITLLKIILCVSAGFLVGYAPLIILTGNEYRWIYDSSVKGVFNFLMRQDYTGVSIEQGRLQSSYLQGIDIYKSIRGLIHYLIHLLPAAVGIAGISSIVSLKYLTEGRIRNLLVLTSFTTSMILAMYIPVITDSNTLTYAQVRGIHERMYINGYLWLMLPVIYVVKWFWTKKTGKVLVFSLLIMQVIGNFNKVNLKKQTISSDLINQTIEIMPNNSTVACFSDISCFGYTASQILHGKKNLTIIPITPQIQLANDIAKKITYQDNPFRIMQSLAESRVRGESVYVAQVSPLYIDFLGLNGYTSILTPSIFSNKISCSNETTYAPKIGIDSPVNFVSNYIKAGITEAFITNSIALANQGRTQELSPYTRIILDLYPNDEFVKSQVVNIVEKSRSNNSTFTECPNSSRLLHAAMECQSVECKLKYHWWAIFSDPFNQQLRLSTASLLNDMGYQQLAQREIQIAKILNNE